MPKIMIHVRLDPKLHAELVRRQRRAKKGTTLTQIIEERLRKGLNPSQKRKA